MAESILAAAVRYARRVAHAPRAPDAALLDLVAESKDPDAFATLIARHGPAVWAACRRQTANLADAEDAFQATFLVLTQNPRSVRRAASVGSYLFGVAIRVARRVKARSAAVPDPLRLTAPSQCLDPAANLSWHEARKALDEELARLPERLRAAVLACYFEGLTQYEAARKLGWTARAVKDRVARARKLLHARLTRRGIDLAATLTLAASAADATAAPPAGVANLLQRLLTGVLPASSVQELVRGDAVTDHLKTVALAVTGSVLLAVGMAAYVRSHPAEPPSPPLEKIGAAPVAPALVAARDFYGDPLPDGAVARLGTVRFQHGQGLRAGFSTPDGSRFVTAGGRKACVWDAETGEELRRFSTGEKGFQETCRLTPDGKTLVIHRLDDGVGPDTVSSWDLETGKELRSTTLPVRRGGWSVYQRDGLSPDGKVVMVFTSGGHLGLYDADTGKALAKLEANGKDVRDACFAGSRHLVTAQKDKKVSVWEVATGKEVLSFDHVDPIAFIATSADGKLLASLEHQTYAIDKRLNKDVVHLWDLTTGKKRHVFSATEKGWWLGLAFAPDGSRLIAQLSTEAGSLGHVWDVTSGKLVKTLAGIDSVMCVSPDGRRLMADGLWDLETGKPMGPPRGLYAFSSAVRLSAEGDRAVAVGYSSVSVWDAKIGKRLATHDLPPHMSMGQWRRVSPDGQYAATTENKEGKIGLLVVKTANGEVVYRSGQGSPGWGVMTVFSPDSRYLYIAPGGKNEPTAVLDLRSRKIVRTMPVVAGDWHRNAFLVDEGKTLILSGKELNGYSTETGKPVFSWKVGFTPPADPHGRVTMGGQRIVTGYDLITFSADGSLAACFLQHGEFDPNLADRIALLDGRTGNILRRWSDSGKRGSGWGALAFSADGRLLATSDKFDVHLWEAATGKKVRTFSGHRAEILGLEFSGTGRRLASASEDGTALVWGLSTTGGGKTEPELHWAELASEDPAVGWAAAWKLAEAPDSALSVLKKHLKAFAKADGDIVRQLVNDLDSDSFKLREFAFTTLMAKGHNAAHIYRAALAAKPSAEQKERLELLLGRLAGPPPAGEDLRTARALSVLEMLGSDAAKSVLKALAKGEAEAWLAREATAGLTRLAER